MDSYPVVVCVTYGNGYLADDKIPRREAGRLSETLRQGPRVRRTGYFTLAWLIPFFRSGPPQAEASALPFSAGSNYPPGQTAPSWLRTLAGATGIPKCKACFWDPEFIGELHLLISIDQLTTLCYTISMVMGRPPIPASKRASRLTAVRFRRLEYRALEQAANKAGESVSDYIRNAIKQRSKS